MFRKMLLKLFAIVFVLVANAAGAEKDFDFLSASLPHDEVSQVVEGYCSYINLGNPFELIKKHEKDLSNSVIYFLVTAYNMEKFAPYFAHNLKQIYEKLKVHNVDFQVRLTCDGKQSDYDVFSQKFAETKFPDTNIRIKLNEQNKGCSATRLDQLLEARQEVVETIRSNKNTFLYLGDGDDQINIYALPIMLAALFETNADCITIERCLARYKESDINKAGVTSAKDPEISELMARKVKMASDYTVNLFSAKNLFVSLDGSTNLPVDEIEQSHKEIEVMLDTLEPLDEYYQRVFKLYTTEFESANIGFNRSPTDTIDLMDTSDPVDAAGVVPLYFYIQHSDSLSHSFLEVFLSICNNVDSFRKFLKAYKKSMDDEGGYSEEECCGDEDCYENGHYYEKSDAALLFGGPKE